MHVAKPQAHKNTPTVHVLDGRKKYEFVDFLGENIAKRFQEQGYDW